MYVTVQDGIFFLHYVAEFFPFSIGTDAASIGTVYRGATVLLPG
jgi:hypothetical protein